MYDAIVAGASELPAGVQMADVVCDSDRTDLITAAAADTVTDTQVCLFALRAGSHVMAVSA